MLETTYRPAIPETERRVMSTTPTFAEALGLLARKKGYFSDRPETFALATMLEQGVITIEQIQPLDIQ